MAIPAQARRLDHARPAAESPPPGIFETFVSAAQAPDTDELAKARREAAQRGAFDGAIGELAKRGISDPNFRRNVIWRDVPVYDEEAIWKGVQRARQQDANAFPDLPGTLDAWRQQVNQPFDQEIAARHARLDRGGGVANFAGGFVSGASDPVQLPFMLVGVGEARSVADAVLQGAKTNAQIAAMQQPLLAVQRAKYGEDLSPTEAAQNIASAAALGGVLSGLGQGYAAMRGRAARPDAQLPDQVEATVGRANMTADEHAAAAVLRRETEVDAASPYQPSGVGDATHRAQLAEAVRAVLGGEHQPSTRARLLSGTAPVIDPVISREAVKARIHTAETSPGHDYNAASGAMGPYQFLKSTWGNLMRRLHPQFAGKSDEALAGLRRDPALNEQAINASMAEYGAVLRANGQPETPGNLYLMHFLGTGEGPKVLRARPDTPIADLVRPIVIEQNPFLRGKTAGDVVAWTRARMGGGDSGAVGGGDASIADQALATIQATRAATDAAVRASDAAPTTGDLIAAEGQPDPPAPAPKLADPYAVPPLTLAQVPTSQVTVDAALMQFKAGGDQFGVTERLQGVGDWNPLLAGRQILWERRDGTLIVADGHQRVGLARRIGAASGRDIPLDAVILREADGVTAAHARTLAALKNISEGTGTVLDAAKVIRDNGREVLGMLPPRSALVRDGAALAHLSPEAFGAVVNDVIKPEHGAAIGRLLPDDPAAHMAMVDLLAKTRPANRVQAESIVRQGIAAGFTDGVQTDMFGSLDSVASLFLERAKVLDGAIGQLKKLKSVFKVAGREADTLETGGVGTIDAVRAAQEASHNATAIDLVERLASARGPVKDAIDAAARRLAEGGKQSAVVDQLVKDIRAIDLRTALLDGERAAQSEATRSGEGYGGEPAPQIVDQNTLSLFDDPHAAPAAIVTDSLEHDLRASPSKTGGGETPAPSEGDRFGFRFDEEGATVDRAQLIKEIDSENAAIDEVKKCL